MSLAAKSLLLIAVLGLAACNNPDRYGAGGPGGSGGPGGAGMGGIDTTGLGDPNNPTSIAYFNQRVGDRVLFAVDQSTLSPEARTILTAQAQWLLQNAGYAAIIEGHADEQCTREYNLALGERRGNAVARALQAQGASSGQITVVSFGEERPQCREAGEDCWSQNRRADLNYAVP